MTAIMFSNMIVNKNMLKYLLTIIILHCLIFVVVLAASIEIDYEGFYLSYVVSYVGVRVKAPRIFCFILTTENQLDNKAQLIYDSWAHLCDNHTFVSVLSNYSNNKSKFRFIPLKPYKLLLNFSLLKAT